MNCTYTRVKFATLSFSMKSWIWNLYGCCWHCGGGGVLLHIPWPRSSKLPIFVGSTKRLDILVIVSWHLGDWLISYLCRFSHPLRKENVVYISDVALKFPAMIYFQLVSRSKVRPVQLKRPPFFMQMLHLFSSFCLHIICTSVFLPVYSSHPVSIIAWNKGFCWSFCVMIFFPWSCWRWRSGVFYCAWVCKRGLSDPRRARVGLTNLFSVPFSSVLDGEFVEFQLFCQWEWR